MAPGCWITVPATALPIVAARSGGSPMSRAAT
jgi:hypothetical protein